MSDNIKKVKKPEVVLTEEHPELTDKEKGEVKVIEKIIENRQIAPIDAFGKLSRTQIELVKRTVAKGASDDELKLFITVCHGAQLNPFLRQAHLVPFWDSKDGIERRAIIVGIDGFRAIAEGSGNYAGNDDPEFDGEKELECEVWEGKAKAKKKIIVPDKAKVSVYKIVEGQRYPFSATARWSEYYPGEKKGARWHSMPYMMLGKCAEALALRKAFPKLLSGIYAQEEMEQANQVANPEAVKNVKSSDYILKAISISKVEELEDLKKKLEATKNYTPAQKKIFYEAIESRINSFNIVQAEVVPEQEEKK